MNVVRQVATLSLLPFALTTAGCKHARTLPVAQTNAPAITSGNKAGPPPSGNPLSNQTPPPLPSLPPAAPTDASAHAPKPPAHTHRLRRKPKTAPDAEGPTTAAATPPATALTASAGPVPSAPQVAATLPAESKPSPIGMLSTGDVTAGAQTRQETVQLIGVTENGLSGIKRTLSDQEQDTVKQIRTFLQKAKAALVVDDIDGAHTLATKAKVLLDELTRS